MPKKASQMRPGVLFFFFFWPRFIPGHQAIALPLLGLVHGSLGETSLVGRPAITVADCKERLAVRLQHRGIRVKKVCAARGIPCGLP